MTSGHMYKHYRHRQWSTHYPHPNRILTHELRWARYMSAIPGYWSQTWVHTMWESSLAMHQPHFGDGDGVASVRRRLYAYLTCRQAFYLYAKAIMLYKYTFCFIVRGLDYAWEEILQPDPVHCSLGTRISAWPKYKLVYQQNWAKD